MDLCYTSTVVPRDLAAIIKTISYNQFMTQLFTAHWLAGVEIFILVFMALDHYIAIVKPLHYRIIMSRKMCHLLIATAWGVGYWHSITLLLMVLSLPFCDHYLCDVKPLLKLVCKDIRVVSILVIANSGMVVVDIFLVSRSSPGSCKALSTCCSHIMVVVLLFVPYIYIYVLPTGRETNDKEISVFYVVIIPMLNPLFYTLRNTEMKSALWKVWSYMSLSKLK
uniref:G-protein coupled receptors family 1 profile domain-containing protein n=1 Tax=Nannospalax galili TaxID=1026970 RepID=A0A8C6QDU7_NANGA